MARTIQQIKQDLNELEETVGIVAVEIRSVYEKYLKILTHSIQKQLILASYHLCTQAYPELFLQLSLNQRQKLQENLKTLVKNAQCKLLSCLEISKESTSGANLTIMEQMLNELPLSQKNLFHLTEPTQKNTDTITNPEELLNWSKKVEQGIYDILERLSQEANRALQQAKILPTQLPPKLLEIALQAEEQGSSISGAPNLLNLLIEAQDDESEESEDSNDTSDITRITAIRLRLSEIEFADPALSIERHQIRSILGKLSKIRQQYHKKRQECSIAEAEAAWRASWYEE